jgi:hypothetical protein
MRVTSARRASPSRQTKLCELDTTWTALLPQVDNVCAGKPVGTLETDLLGDLAPTAEHAAYTAKFDEVTAAIAAQEKLIKGKLTDRTVANKTLYAAQRRALDAHTREITALTNSYEALSDEKLQLFVAQQEWQNYAIAGVFLAAGSGPWKLHGLWPDEVLKGGEPVKNANIPSSELTSLAAKVPALTTDFGTCVSDTAVATVDDHKKHWNHEWTKHGGVHNHNRPVRTYFADALCLLTTKVALCDQALNEMQTAGVPYKPRPDSTVPEILDKFAAGPTTTHYKFNEDGDCQIQLRWQPKAWRDATSAPVADLTSTLTLQNVRQIPSTPNHSSHAVDSF